MRLEFEIRQHQRSNNTYFSFWRILVYFQKHSWRKANTK